MKKIFLKESCDICDNVFKAEFIQHEKPEDDFSFEREVHYEESYDEDGTVTIEPVVDVEEDVYPHVHEQPTLECHVCPKCRSKIQ